MLSLFIGLLSLALVLTSVMLILMVLVQLPKKEAGLGMAFGGATADALFGAGSGTVLSRWTKYASGIFLALSLLLSMLRNHEARASGRTIESELAKPAPAAAAGVGQPIVTNPAAAPLLPILEVTNPPAATSSTSAPAAAPAVPAPAPTPNPGQ